MKRLAALVMLAALALAGCMTARPAPVDEEAQEPGEDHPWTGTADSLLARAVTLIGAASPASLVEAARLASTADSLGSPGAAAAAIAATDLRRLLYPELAAASGGTGLSLAQVRITSPFLSAIAPSLVLLDPRAVLEGPAEARLHARLEEADRMQPGAPLPPYLRGLLAARRAGGAREARALFEESLKRAPTFSPAASALSDLIIAGGTAAEELPLLVHLASLPHTDTLRFAALARAFLAAGRPEQAADAAARGLLLAPDDPRFVVLRAGALEASGNWYQALWVLDSLLKLDPDQTEAILQKARILHEKADNDPEALRMLADAESRFPSEASFPELRGRILLAAGRGREGIEELTHALELEPGRLSVLSLLLDTAVREGRWADAVSWLARIPESARGPDDLRRAWQTAMGLGNSEQAIASAQALEKMVGGAAPLALEARAMIAWGRLPAALLIIDHALRARDTTPSLRSDLLTLRAAAGSPDPLQDLRAALKENPDNAEALVAIAEALAAQGDHRKAAEYAKRASTLSPGNAALAQKARDYEKLAASGQ